MIGLFFMTVKKKYDRIYKSNFCEHKNFNYVGTQNDHTFFTVKKKSIYKMIGLFFLAVEKKYDRIKKFDFCKISKWSHFFVVVKKGTIE